MTERIQIRRATSVEASALGELASRSKALWGYSAQFMESCRDELRVSADIIRSGRVFVAEADGTIEGFFSLEDHASGDVELGHLFVEPGSIGTGVGRLLIERACQEALVLGFERMIIQGDPNAEGFYLRVGAKRTGELQSVSIPGRMLPLFEITLSDWNEDG